MNKPKHTPGPWKPIELDDGGFEIIESNRDTSCSLAYVEGASTQREHLANARLIAAAPEMLGSLKDISDRFHDLCCRQDACAPECVRSMNAIAKAEGRE